MPARRTVTCRPFVAIPGLLYIRAWVGAALFRLRVAPTEDNPDPRRVRGDER